MNEAEAEAALQAVGLKKGTVTEQCSDTVPPGHVIDQEPNAGTSVLPGTAVNLVISSDCPCTCTVPNLSGKCGAEIDAALEVACLKKGDVQYAYDPGVSEGCVISQDPSPGATIPCGSEVDVTISQCTCNTPTVQTLSVEEDVNCTSVRLRGQVSDNGGCEYWEYCFHCWNSDATWSMDTAWTTGGTVGVPFSEKITLPGPGKYYYRALARNCGGETEPQDSVEFIITCTEVPDLTYKSDAEIDAALAEKYLKKGNIRYDYNDVVPQGLVISQDPVAGTQVPCDTTVNLVISAGKCFQRVPNLIGMDELEVDAALKQSHLGRGSTEYISDEKVPTGQVIDQDPNAGQVVPCGSNIDLIISKCANCNPPAVETLPPEDVNCTSVRLCGRVAGPNSCNWRYRFHCWKSDATWEVFTVWKKGATVGGPFCEKITVPGPGTYYYTACARNCAGEVESQSSMSFAPMCQRCLCLIGPGADEQLAAGSVYQIRWDENCCDIPYVLIRYSADGGNTWNPIDTNTIPAGIVPNTGLYPWQVPALDSHQCLLSISDPNDPTASDTSDGSFKIYRCKVELLYDLNHDCYVDLRDFAELAKEWLDCGNPFDPACDQIIGQ
jgi:beta-lactam-binding protein with PASTA domain